MKQFLVVVGLLAALVCVSGGDPLLLRPFTVGGLPLGVSYHEVFERLGQPSSLKYQSDEGWLGQWPTEHIQVTFRNSPDGLHAIQIKGNSLEYEGDSLSNDRLTALRDRLSSLSLTPFDIGRNTHDWYLVCDYAGRDIRGNVYQAMLSVDFDEEIPQEIALKLVEKNH